jgi:chemotaxis protein CheX
MRYEYIEPFVSSTIRTLDAVIQTDISQGEVILVRGDDIRDDVAIMVRLEGDSQGSIILNMPTGTALNICNAMFGEAYEALTPMGMDSLAELANMIAGNATSTLNDMGYDFRVLPPLVFTREEIGEKTPEIEVFQVPLFTEYGEITMNVALRADCGSLS